MERNHSCQGLDVNRNALFEMCFIATPFENCALHSKFRIDSLPFKLPMRLKTDRNPYGFVVSSQFTEWPSQEKHVSNYDSA